MKRPWLLILIACILGELACIHIGIIVVFSAIPIGVAGFFIIKYFIPKYFVYSISVFAVFIAAYINTDIRIERMNDFSSKYIEGEYYNYTGNIDDIKERGGVYKLKVGKALVYYKAEDFKYCIGDRVEVYAKARKIKQRRNRGEFDYELYYRSKGIGLLFDARRISLLSHKKYDIRQGMSLLAEHLLRNIDKFYQEKEAGFLKAVLLGDKSFLDKDMYRLYSKSGIAHLLAISGLHISIIGASVYKLFRKISGYAVSIILSFFFILFYIILIDSSVSVIRAFIMIIMFFGAQYFGRNYDLLNSAIISAFIIVFLNPLQLYQAAFLLSFFAVFSIAFSGAILRRLKIENKYIKLILGGFLMQAFNMPIVIYFFYRLPTYSVILNLLVIPLMSVLIVFAIISLIFTMNLYIVWTSSFVVSLIIRLYSILCIWFLRLPFSSFIIGKPDLLQIFLYYSLLLGIYFYIGKIKIVRIRKVCLFLFLLPTLILFIHKRSVIEINFLDVGQGDCIYIRYKDCDILLDCGSTSNRNIGSDTLEPFLLSGGIKDIEKIFITHADLDHVSGILYLLENVNDIAIEEVYLPIQAKKDKAYDKIKKSIKNRKISLYYISASDKIIEDKDFCIKCVSPGNIAIEEINEQSIVLFLKYKYFKALFMGDAGIYSEDIIMQNNSFAKELKNISLIKIGHHGSKSSTKEEFIKYLGPNISIFSYGKNNLYSHPNIDVYNRAVKYSDKVYETEKFGSINVALDGSRIKVDTFIK